MLNKFCSNKFSQKNLFPRRNVQGNYFFSGGGGGVYIACLTGFCFIIGHNNQRAQTRRHGWICYQNPPERSRTPASEAESGRWVQTKGTQPRRFFQTHGFDRRIPQILRKACLKFLLELWNDLKTNQSFSVSRKILLKLISLPKMNFIFRTWTIFFQSPF